MTFTSTNERLAQWVVSRRQFGAAWIELRAPAQARWEGEVEGVCTVEAAGAKVELPALSLTAALFESDLDGTSSCDIPVQFASFPVRLSAGDRTALPFSISIPRRNQSEPRGQVTLFVPGKRWWQFGASLTVYFTLVPPHSLDELACHIARCTGFAEVTWSVKGDYVAVIKKGVRHPLLEDVILEVSPVLDEIKGWLDIGERFQGPGASILGPDRRRHAFSFPLGELERGKRIVEELLRPYGKEHRNLPIPGREPLSYAHQKLPLPTRSPAENASDLPTPSSPPGEA